MARTRLLPSLAVAAVLLAGCGAGGAGPVAEPAPERDAPAAEETLAATTAPEAASPAPDAAASPAPEAPTAPASGGALPADAFDFAVPAVGGGEVVGGDLARTDLALWFWAPW